MVTRRHNCVWLEPLPKGPSDLFHDIIFKGRMGQVLVANADSNLKSGDLPKVDQIDLQILISTCYITKIYNDTPGTRQCVLYYGITLKSLWVLCSILASWIWTPYSAYTAGNVQAVATICIPLPSSKKQTVPLECSRELDMGASNSWWSADHKRRVKLCSNSRSKSPRINSLKGLTSKLMQ